MDAQLVLPLLLLFGSVAMLSGLGATYALRRTSPVDRRLRELANADTSPAAAVDSLDLMRASYGSLQKFTAVLPKSHKQLSALRRRLAGAGFERPEAAVLYTLVEKGLPLLAGVTSLMYLPPPRGVLLALFVSVVAYMLPGLWLGRKTAKRKKQIQNGLPDALDLLLVSIEAGSGLDQAISKVAAELQLSYPMLSHEFRHMVTDMRAGRPRAEALRQFAERTKVEDVRTLVTTLIQTDKFGTSLGQALRTHADSARVKRRQRAEERAQKLGVKLVFPLVLCLFPAMYVVVLGPAVLKIIHTLGTSLGR